MSKGMLGKISLSDYQGPRNDLEEKIAGEDGKMWLTALKKFLRKENPWEESKEKIKEAVKSALFKFLSPITISATSEPFIVKNKFIEDISFKAKVKIRKVDDSFRSLFCRKIEEPTYETILRPFTLEKTICDSEIIIELGKMAEMTLAAIYSLMEMQDNGQEGTLTINGYANNFYVRDIHMVLRKVGIFWHEDGWFIYAGKIDPLPRKSHDNIQFFSRYFHNSES